jgi:hypothetical protein
MTMSDTTKPDTRQRFTVTVEITLKAQSPERAQAIVAAFLEPLPAIPPFSITYPPEVLCARVRDGEELTPEEALAFEDLLAAAGITDDPIGPTPEPTKTPGHGLEPGQCPHSLSKKHHSKTCDWCIAKKETKP